MSALAKVFVVFICVLSVVFFGTSATLFTTRSDWKAAYNQLRDENRKELEAVTKRINELLGQTSTLEKDLITIKAAHGEMSNELAQTKQELSEEKKTAKLAGENAAKQTVLTGEAHQSLKSSVDSYTKLQEAHEKAKGDREESLKQTETANGDRERMRLDLEKSQQELHNLKVEHTKLVSDFESLEIRHNALASIHGGDVPVDIAPPIDGVVKKVDLKEKLVLLSVGKDQKVELGHEFTVHRGGQFIGKVKVIKVYPDLSGAQVLFMKEGAEIQNGDRATTNI